MTRPRRQHPHPHLRESLVAWSRAYEPYQAARELPANQATARPVPQKQMLLQVQVQVQQPARHQPG
jgi:hypothetical protein